MVRRIVVIGVGSAIAFVVHALWKELKYLHKAVNDTMDVNNKMEILYSKCLAALTLNEYTDNQRLRLISNILVNGFRPEGGTVVNG